MSTGAQTAAIFTCTVSLLCCPQVGTRAEEIARELGRISAEAASEGASGRAEDLARTALSNATDTGGNGTARGGGGVDWESQTGDVAVAQAAFEQQREEDLDERIDRIDRIDRG